MREGREIDKKTTNERNAPKWNLWKRESWDADEYEIKRWFFTQRKVKLKVCMHNEQL